jgi:hypothetical protein
MEFLVAFLIVLFVATLVSPIVGVEDRPAVKRPDRVPRPMVGTWSGSGAGSPRRLRDAGVTSAREPERVHPTRKDPLCQPPPPHSASTA